MIVRIVLALFFAFLFFLRLRWQEKEAYFKNPRFVDKPNLKNNIISCFVFLAPFFYIILTFIHIWFLKIFGS